MDKLSASLMTPGGALLFSGKKSRNMLCLARVSRTQHVLDSGVYMSHVTPVRSNRWTGLLLASCLTLGTACALHRVEAGSNTSAITQAEIDSVHATSAYDAVRRLRPLFLTVQGKMSVDPSQPPAQPNVYVDNMYYGDITTLRQIEASAIESIKFYSASEAQFTFGRGNMAGVISILTKH